MSDGKTPGLEGRNLVGRSVYDRQRKAWGEVIAITVYKYEGVYYRIHYHPHELHDKNDFETDWVHETRITTEGEI